MYFYLTVRLVQIWSLNLHGENLRASERNGEIQIFQLKNFNILPKVIIKRKDKHFGELTKIHTPRDFLTKTADLDSSKIKLLYLQFTGVRKYELFHSD